MKFLKTAAFANKEVGFFYSYVSKANEGIFDHILVYDEVKKGLRILLCSFLGPHKDFLIETDRHSPTEDCALRG